MLSLLSARGKRAARRPYDPPDRPAARAGGDERATLAVTAALAETGARALVATDSGELAGELQAIGGLFVRFPAATKNPLTMALNMRRLQRIIASERIDLVHARSRWAAWAAVKACRKAKRPLVTSLPVDGGRTRPRSSFETAVAEGDHVIAASEFAAGRAETLFPSVPKRLRLFGRGWIYPSFSPERVSGAGVADVRASWGVAAHERVVLMPSRLAPGRGQQTLIEAAALIKDRGLDDVRFVLGRRSGEAGVRARAGCARGQMRRPVHAPLISAAASISVCWPRPGASRAGIRTTRSCAATPQLVRTSDTRRPLTRSG